MSKELIKKWEDKKGRAACIDVPLVEGKANMPYWDHDFVNDLLNYVEILKKKIDTHERGLLQLRVALKKEGICEKE